MIQFHVAVKHMFETAEKNFGNNEKLKELSESKVWYNMLSFIQEKTTRSNSIEQQQEYLEPMKKMLIDKLREQGFN